MSITAETAKAHANDPAVLCCRAEGGITIEPANLEDPAIFDELVDSGLLNLDGCLKIGQVLGAKLTKTSDSLCPLTADNVDGFKTDDELVGSLGIYTTDFNDGKLNSGVSRYASRDLTDMVLTGLQRDISSRFGVQKRKLLLRLHLLQAFRVLLLQLSMVK